ncbi:MAG: hypothetical protein B6241_00970 [Spirochaetaceae bacterium 4572_59]|nr:MAG: hypothetical protein B6241_00970 [Spirochaetaceae bacterium 4572_59]
MNQDNYPQTVQTPDEDEIDLLDLIGVLFKHKWLIIGMSGFSALFIIIYSIVSLKLPADKSYLPNTFKPYSTVMINDSSSGGGLSSMLDSSGLGSLAALAGVSGGGSSNSALAEKLAGSNTFLDILAGEFNLAEVYDTSESKFPLTDLRKMIKENLRLEADEATGTMTIGYEDINPELATKIANKMVELLENEFSRIDRDSNTSQKALLEQKIQDVKWEIDRLQKEYLAFQSRYNIVDLETLAEGLTTQVLEISSQMIALDGEISSMQDRIGMENPRIIESKRKKEMLESQLRLIQEVGNKSQPALNDLPGFLIQEQKLKQNIEIQLTVLSTLMQQYEVIKLTDRGTGPTFQILEKAEVPEMKSGPSRGKLCIIVTMAGFFMSLFGAFLLEFWQNLKQDPERMKKLRGEV